MQAIWSEFYMDCINILQTPIWLNLLLSCVYSIHPFFGWCVVLVIFTEQICVDLEFAFI